MKRNLVLFSTPERLERIRDLDVYVAETYFTGKPVECGIGDDCMLFLLKDENKDHIEALLTNNHLDGELRFVYHTRTFPIPGPGNVPQVNHVALDGFVQRVKDAFPNLEVQPGKQGKHLRGDNGAFPYEKVIAILTNVNGDGNPARFDAIWDWLKPPDRRITLFWEARHIHEQAITEAGGGMHPVEVTGRAEIEAITGWGALMPNELPPMDRGDEKFREFILGVIDQTG